MIVFKILLILLGLVGIWLYLRAHASFAFAQKPVAPESTTFSGSGLVIFFEREPYLVYESENGAVLAKELAPLEAARPFSGEEVSVTGELRDSVVFLSRIAPAQSAPDIELVSVPLQGGAEVNDVSLKPLSIAGGDVTTAVTFSGRTSTIAFVPGALQEIDKRVVILANADTCAASGCVFAVLETR